MLERKRQAQQEEFEAEKAKRKRVDESGTSLAARGISSKFQQARIGNVQEQAFRQKTVGLCSAEDFAKAQHASTAGPTDEEQKQKDEEEMKRKNKLSKKAKKKKRKEAKKSAARLSFGEDDEEADEGDDGANKTTKTGKAKKIAKDPTIDTSFLPDKQREENEKSERLRLEQQWKTRQVEIQKEKLEITYSYWDGSGHRRTCTVTKGSSIGDFLEIVRQDLSKEFRREMASVSSDALLYVKEDLILPHDITFYDLIVTKARGKSGPLFHFDVHDDIRVGPLDSRVEKDESHPGKVVDRRWYERNKHIFPASRWEIYDPAKDYGSYTIHGGEVHTKKEKK